MPHDRSTGAQVCFGREAPTRRSRKQPFTQIGDELSLTDRFGMYS